MEPIAKDTSQIQITPADIAELLRTNPVAAQQLTAITWHRIALELEARLVVTKTNAEDTGDTFYSERKSKEP
tara:strand:- start:441 stop:656 length:216 start_codon:yes stop_codon:yes gene_type:complete